VLLIGLSLWPAAIGGQSTKVGSTLRYGSGLLDVPVASVLPDGAFAVTYSGFFTTNETELLTDAAGGVTGQGPFDGGWRGDLAVAYGLWDFVEFGTTVQSLRSNDEGGPLLGVFGRLALVHAEKNGVGLAVGGRWLNGPDFGDDVAYSPTRLGIADRRFRRDLGGETNTSGFTFYAVGSFDLEGPDTALLPQHDWTLTGGWGSGLFREGDGFDWYEDTDSNGWFAGAAVHMEVAPGKVLTVESEHNGFDLNVGMGLDLNGVRIGAHLLGANYSEDSSIYRSRKFGLSLTVALCSGGRCQSSLRHRVTADTVFIPPPPPDTIVRREPLRRLPVSEPISLCLANGQDVAVLITAAGDTLVGPERVVLSSLRPMLDWAGQYAEGLIWHDAGELIDHDGRQFRPVPGLLRLRCAGLLRTGDYRGVPLFAAARARAPYSTVYVPIRPGVWRAYQLSDQGIPASHPPS